MLSKSQIIHDTNCPKSLWLYVHKRNQQVISEATRAICERGTSVGELTQKYFSFGEMAVQEKILPDRDHAAILITENGPAGTLQAHIQLRHFRS